jgi:hypothetical protein
MPAPYSRAPLTCGTSPKRVAVGLRPRGEGYCGLDKPVRGRNNDHDGDEEREASFERKPHERRRPALLHDADHDHRDEVGDRTHKRGDDSTSGPQPIPHRRTAPTISSTSSSTIVSTLRAMPECYRLASTRCTSGTPGR